MSPLHVTSPVTLIIGCGYLGRRVAGRWLSMGRTVTALTRRNGEALRKLGLEPLMGDVLDPDTLRQLPEASTVLYAVGLDRAAGASMEEVYVGGLANVLGTLPRPARFIYISSTSVYGQTDGGWVDELAPTEPLEHSGRLVLQAERLLRREIPEAIILRFGGIYGPDRLLRRQVQLQSGEAMSGDPGRWLNLIHVEDGVDAVLAAEARGTPGETFNIIDDQPVTRQEYYEFLAGLVGARAPQFDGRSESPRANRRVRSALAKTALGWHPRYPSYREGLPAAIRESKMA